VESFKGDNTSRDLGEFGQKSFRLVEWRGLHIKNLGIFTCLHPVMW
jgi:hypothetical protein